MFKGETNKSNSSLSAAPTNCRTRGNKRRQVASALPSPFSKNFHIGMDIPGGLTLSPCRHTVVIYYKYMSSVRPFST